MTTILVAGLAVALIIERRNQSKLREGEARLREQKEQASALTQEHERLSALANRAAPPDNSAAEAAKLRSEISSRKQRTNDLGRKSTAKVSPRSQSASSTSTPHTDDYYQQLRQIAGSKPTEARDLGRALGEYAFEHQNQFATSLDQLSPYLSQFGATVSGSNHYEIIYQGSLDQLKGLPWGSIAVVRDAEPWPGPDGTMMRVYGFPDGHSQMIIDNVQPWISEHVIMPQASGSAGR